MKGDVLEGKPKRRVKVSQSFITALSIVSIIGFIGIVSETLFDFNLTLYVEALLMFVIGLGLMFEARWKHVKAIHTEGLTRDNFTSLLTVIIGTIALLTGIFSFPFMRIEHPTFLAVKGIIAVIAIIIIIIQTWIVETPTSSS